MSKRNVEPLGPGAEHGIAGECFEHDVKWYSGGVECPVCKLEADLAAAVEALRKIRNGNYVGNKDIRAGEWLADVDMAAIARDALARLEGGKA